VWGCEVPETAGKRTVADISRFNPNDENDDAYFVVGTLVLDPAE